MTSAKIPEWESNNALSLEGKAFCWFDVLPIHSVHNWSQFKNMFKTFFDNYDPIKIHNNL